MSAMVATTTWSSATASASADATVAVGVRGQVAAADANAACIHQAMVAKAASWTCFGDVLTTAGRDANGKDVVTQHAVAAPAPRITTSATRVAAAAASSDDYDSWCENGTICGRKISDYIAEVKGNGAYGDANGVIGAVDVIVRQAFDGPWPRWRGLLIWDAGPAITTSSYQINCRINVTGPDGHCGGTQLYFGTISSGNWRSWYPSSTSYTYNSERLKGGTYYHEDAFGSFHASGHSQTFYYGTLHTGRWRYCSSNCKYYQVPWVA